MPSTTISPYTFAKSQFFKAGKYIISFQSTTATSWRFFVRGFDSNGNALGNDFITGGGMTYRSELLGYLSGSNITVTSRIITVNKDCYLVFGLVFGDVTDQTTVVGSQFELGSTATSYEPYQGQTYDITFPSEAGTVYGGTLDVTSGVLTVDRAMDTITKDGSWYGFAVGSGNASAFIRLNNYQNVKYVDGIHSYNGAISSVGTEAPNYWVSARQNEVPQGDMCFAYSNDGQLRIHRTDVSKITDIASFKENLPDVQIVYPLATPVTCQLTPQEVRTLLGQNNIWADTGDVTVEYRADTKLYIQNLTKPTEDDMTANAAITSGKFFMIGNRLFMATAAIASGAMIIPGTNCTELSLADALNNINA